jgi:hypothetical protein
VALLFVVLSAYVATGVDLRSGGNTGRRDQVISLRIVAAGRTATVKVLNHGCVTIRTDTKQEIALAADVLADSAGVGLRVWAPPTGETAACDKGTPLSSQRLAAGSRVSFTARGVALEAEWLSTKAVTLTVPAGNGPCTQCCVTCDGFTWCACEVVTTCGRCCCPNACGCEPTNQPFRG